MHGIETYGSKQTKNVCEDIYNFAVFVLGFGVNVS